jgi:hypothetical protein
VVATEHSNPSLAHASERRPAVWPWLLMPLAALALYLALHSVRMSAPQTEGHSQTAQPAPDSESEP